MKKILLVSFTFSINHSFAATGKANDDELFMLSVLVILLIALGFTYLIDFLKSRFKQTRKGHCIQEQKADGNDEFTMLNLKQAQDEGIHLISLH